MADNRKYYYLKLKESFYDSDSIVILESMQDGYKYSNILLKLYLKSLKHNGRLSLNDRIPYNSTMLAQITRHDVGTIEKAINLFQELGLIEILDNGAIYMSDIQNFIGSSSTEGDRRREYRKNISDEIKQLQGIRTNVGQTSDKRQDKRRTNVGQTSDKRRTNVGQTSDIWTPDIDIDKDIDKEKGTTYPKRKTQDSFSIQKAVDDYTDHPDVKSALLDFVSMRKSMKKPIETKRAFNMLCNRLDSLSGDDDEKRVALLNDAIFHNWQNVYEQSLRKGEEHRGNVSNQGIRRASEEESKEKYAYLYCNGDQV